MKPLLVLRVDRFTQGDESAEVTLRSDASELVAFSFPCDLEVGEEIPNRLNVLDGNTKSAYLDDWPDDLRNDKSVERIERTGPFSYRGVGRVIDQRAGLVQVLGFVLDFGEVPCQGHVEFECMRVDV